VSSSVGNEKAAEVVAEKASGIVLEPTVEKSAEADENQRLGIPDQ